MMQFLCLLFSPYILYLYRGNIQIIFVHFVNVSVYVLQADQPIGAVVT